MAPPMTTRPGSSDAGADQKRGSSCTAGYIVERSMTHRFERGSQTHPERARRFPARRAARQRISSPVAEPSRDIRRLRAEGERGTMQSRGGSQPRVRPMTSCRWRHHRHSPPRRSLSLFRSPSGVAPATRPPQAVRPSVPSDVPRAVVSDPVTGGIRHRPPGHHQLRSPEASATSRASTSSPARADAYGSAERPGLATVRWKVTTASSAPYKTRIVVYRPIDPRRFDGTVVVEWLNVSGGVDAGCRMADGPRADDPLRHGLRRRQCPGDGRRRVEDRGSGAIRLLEATPGTASRTASTSKPVPPSDAMRPPFSDGLHPERLLAFGESQSALRLVTYIDALGPQITRCLRRLLRLQQRGRSALPLSQAPQRIDPHPVPDVHPDRSRRARHVVRDRDRPDLRRLPARSPAPDDAHPRVGGRWYGALRLVRFGRIDGRHRERRRPT